MCRLEGHFEVQVGEVSPCLQPRLSRIVILRRETPKDPVTHCIADSSATPSPKGSALKNLNAENARFLLDHFVDVGKIFFYSKKNGDLKSG